MIVAVPQPVASSLATPAAIVRSLDRTERELGRALRQWKKALPPPRIVVRLALSEQRTLRTLALTPALSAAVVRIDPAWRDDLRARADLSALARVSPPARGRPKLAAPPSAAHLLAWYLQAQHRFGIRWQLLAAINFVETAFGKVRNTSGAGAQGPMQFEPATWKEYGLGGNIDNPRDAILAAANYLASSGGRGNERNALYHYNPSQLYVDAVVHYADRIQSDPNSFYAYYCWRVYFHAAVTTNP